MSLTNAQFALMVTKVVRRAAAASGDLAEGMWNPDFCSDDASTRAAIFISDIQSALRWIDERIEVKE